MRFACVLPLKGYELWVIEDYGLWWHAIHSPPTELVDNLGYGLSIRGYGLLEVRL